MLCLKKPIGKCLPTRFLKYLPKLILIEEFLLITFEIPIKVLDLKIRRIISLKFYSFLSKQFFTRLI